MKIVRPVPDKVGAASLALLAHRAADPADRPIRARAARDRADLAHPQFLDVTDRPVSLTGVASPGKASTLGFFRPNVAFWNRVFQCQ